MRHLRNVNDILAGLFLIGIALLALGLTWGVRAGTALRMGPGYVPKMLVGIQIFLGVCVVLQGWLRERDPAESWSLRAIIWVLASITFFALTLEPFGLAVAVLGLVILSALAHGGTRPVEAGVLAAVLAVFSILVFVTGLGLTIPVWPRFLVQ
jgi:putative tricarboxylic transport membrane protein